MINNSSRTDDPVIAKAKRATAERRAIKAQKRRIEEPAERVWRTAENPFFSTSAAPSRDNPRRIPVLINLAESAVASLHARGQLSDLQVRAADKFRMLWEAMGGTGAGAFDYSKDIVDGGGPRVDLPERVLMAGEKLAAAEKLLGRRDYELVRRVCGEGLALAEVGDTRRARDTAADNLRSSLDELVVEWGIATRRETVNDSRRTVR